MSFRAFCYNKPPNGHLFCPLDIMVGLLINYPDHCIVANITSKEHKAAYCYECGTMETYYSESHTDVIIYTYKDRSNESEILVIASLFKYTALHSRRYMALYVRSKQLSAERGSVPFARAPAS